MPETLGYHLVKTAFGTWLPGDVRGYWSQEWSAKEGFRGSRRFHDQEDRGAMEFVQRRMRQAPTVLSEGMIEVIVSAIQECVRKSNGGLKIMAAAIESTHMHLLIPYSGRDIEITAKWLADQTTKAVHRRTTHQGLVWSKNNWIRHIFQPEYWENSLLYIDDHNERSGRGRRPYPFLCEVEL